MRKRLLYWLAAFYLFVVQVVIVAHLWQEPRLYILAGINFLVLVFLSILFALTVKKPIAKKDQQHSQENRYHKQYNTQKHDGKHMLYRFAQHYLFVIVLFLLPLAVAEHMFLNFSPVSVWRIVLLFVLLFVLLLKAVVQKKIFFAKRQFGTRSILFLLSIFVLFLLYGLAKNLGIESRLAIVLALLLSLFLFILSIKLFKARRMQRFWSFWSIRLYVILLIVAIVVYVFGGYLDIVKQEKYVDEYPWVYTTWEVIVDKAQNIFSEDVTKVTVVSGSDIDSADLSLDDSDLSSGAGQILTANFAGGTGETAKVVPEPMGSILRNADAYGSDDPLHYIDVIVYLLEDTQTELADDKYNLSFDNMSKTNKDYIYFKTAYYKKLIGTALKPSAKVKCDNYLVMKGILENRDVSGQTGDIFAKYFAKAKELGILNSCKPGAYLTKKNL